MGGRTGILARACNPQPAEGAAALRSRHPPRSVPCRGSFPRPATAQTMAAHRRVCDISRRRTVDLDLVEWERAQVAERGIARPEIVHRDAHAEFRAAGAGWRVLLVSLEENASVISSSSRLGAARRGEDAQTVLARPRLLELSRREIYGDFTCAGQLDGLAQACRRTSRPAARSARSPRRGDELRRARSDRAGDASSGPGLRNRSAGLDRRRAGSEARTRLSRAPCAGQLQVATGLHLRVHSRARRSGVPRPSAFAR